MSSEQIMKKREEKRAEEEEKKKGRNFIVWTGKRPRLNFGKNVPEK